MQSASSQTQATIKIEGELEMAVVQKLMREEDCRYREEERFVSSERILWGEEMELTEDSCSRCVRSSKTSIRLRRITYRLVYTSSSRIMRGYCSKSIGKGCEANEWKAPRDHISLTNALTQYQKRIRELEVNLATAIRREWWKRQPISSRCVK